MSYDFPAVAGNYVVFLAAPNPLPINGPTAHPTGLTMWVYGDDSHHFLNAWIEDAAGEVQLYTFGQVNHSGWQQMFANFDDFLGWPNGHVSGEDNGHLDYPISLFALVLDGMPDGQASSGVIYLDQLSTMGTAPIPLTPTLVPEQPIAPTQDVGTPPQSIGPKAVIEPSQLMVGSGLLAYCESSGANPCLIAALEEKGASPEAIAFARRMDGEAVLINLDEIGVVDLAEVEYPLRVNTNVADFFVNGTPLLLSFEKLYHPVNERLQKHPDFDALAARYSNLEVAWRRQYQIIASEEGPSGGQRFVLRYPIVTGCPVCFVGVSADVAVDFDVDGVFQGVTILDLVPDQQIGGDFSFASSPTPSVTATPSATSTPMPQLPTSSPTTASTRLPPTVAPTATLVQSITSTFKPTPAPIQNEPAARSLCGGFTGLALLPLLLFAVQQRFRGR
ncbi:MAG: hypothetical protein KDI55_25305 [Anaerolineae bacterium]|nr:hypothetical protein [Anaerolineae bacterium]MCB0257051.1 hypothetical protein [Anaerolineae bacterium]